MRLLHRNYKGDLTFTADLHDPPPYAILSHTWGDNEVRYQDFMGGTEREKEAYAKVEFVAQQAEKDGLGYFWIDTCCIDKTNGAEVSAAIRSMFRWYRESAVCYVYLSDVSKNKRSKDGREPWEDTFRGCRWFKRGWTLQELIAPTKVEFFGRGQYLGSRAELSVEIQAATGIDIKSLQGRPLDCYSFSTRLRWAIDRETTVPEDRAYALMGICGIVMTPQYGEGKENARMRLERKIIKQYGEKALDYSAENSRASHGGFASQESLLEQRQLKMSMLDFDAIDSRRMTIKPAFKKTCRWALEHPVYQAWRDRNAFHEHHGFFWIKGKPGAGKSVLIKFLDKHTSQNKDPQDICLSFYFNARGDRLEKSLLGMYRSLLSQLCLAAPEVQVVLDKSRAVNYDSIEVIQELQRLFLIATMRLQKRRLFCFIDALDECRGEDVQKMIDYFRDLGIEAVDEDISVNVCFASRHYPAVDVPTGLQLILEDAGDHANDLCEYVGSQVFRVGKSTKAQSIPATVRDTILNKANGVFLWVVLVVEILKKEYLNGRLNAVNKRLDQTPKGLSELFQDILQRDCDNIDEFLLCLKWILHAKRPLTLQEFYFAMMARVDDQNTDSSVEISSDFMHGYLLSSSKGLAELTKSKTPRVQFIHESVRDFFMTEEGFKHFKQEGQTSASCHHEELKQYCIRRITSVDARACKIDPVTSSTWNSMTAKARSKEANDRFPFLDYAVKSVWHHSNQAAESSAQYDFLVNVDLDDWVDKINCLSVYKVDLYSKPVDLVYLCAERDCANLISVLAEHGHELTISGGQRYHTPLLAAFATGSSNSARMLLDCAGAVDSDRIINEVMSDKVQRRQAFDRSHAARPWFWAIEQGLENLALHLLPSAELEGLIIREHGRTMSPVTAAAASGCRLVIKALLARGVDVNMDGANGVALLEASAAGDKRTVELLLSHGARVEANSTYNGRPYYTALQAASVMGHEQIVDTLIAHGADVNAQFDRLPNNALQAAAMRGRLRMLKVLLKRGADVNAQHPKAGRLTGGTLCCAAQHDQAEAVEMLLAHGARDVCPGGASGRYERSLMVASSRGHEKVVEVLLRVANRADIDALGQDAKPLVSAAANGHEKVVEMLILHGADIDIPGSIGNALQRASENGHSKVVEILLARGADICTLGPNGSALQVASRHGHEEVAEMLLQALGVINWRNDCAVMNIVEDCLRDSSVTNSNILKMLGHWMIEQNET